MTVQLPAYPSEWFGYTVEAGAHGRRAAPMREGARIFAHREREVAIGHIDASQRLAVSPACAWQLITDPSTWDKWFAVHDSWISEPPATLDAGTRMSLKLKMLGVTNALDWVVEAIENGTRLELTGTGLQGLSVRLMFRVSPAGSGSWITVNGQFSGTLLSPAILDAAETEGTRQLVASLAGLDRLARETWARPELRLVHSVR